MPGPEWFTENGRKFRIEPCPCGSGYFETEVSGRWSHHTGDAKDAIKRTKERISVAQSIEGSNRAPGPS